MRLGSRRRLRWVLAVFGLVGLSATAGFASAVNRTLETGGVVGYYTSIAIGDDGNPVISHFDFTNADLDGPGGNRTHDRAIMSRT